MALDPMMAERLVEFFDEHRPEWAAHSYLPPRTTAVLAIVAARGAGYEVPTVADAFFKSQYTVRTYHRDTARYCGTSAPGLERQTLRHLLLNDPQLLAELLG